MSKPVLIAILGFIVIVLSYVSADLGLTETALNIDTSIRPDIWDVLVSIGASLWQMMSFQMIGVPAVINVFLTVPFYLMLFFIVVEFVRGI